MRPRKTLSIERLELRFVLSASPVISEFMALNQDTLADEDGDFSDWIEIHNPGAESISLDGWFLTDSADDPQLLTRWAFPDGVDLSPGEFLIVFASNKNRGEGGAELHANFALGASGEHLALVEPDGMTVATLFGPYPPQVSGVSYGLGPLSDEQYFSTPTPGAVNVPDVANPNDSELVISEFLAVNVDGIADEDGEHSDWIEIHNQSGATLGLDGWFLTDRTDDKAQWRFPDVQVPAGGFLVVFASGKDRAVAGAELHTNFALASVGEYLALVEPDGVTTAFAYAPLYSPQVPDTSYGIGPGGVVQYFNPPTPAAANEPGYSGVADLPTFAQPSGAFVDSVLVELTTSTPGAMIHYTLNGTEPSESSATYTGPITLTGPATIAAKAFAPGMVPSSIARQTYIALDASLAARDSDIPLVLIDTLGVGVPGTGSTSEAMTLAAFIDTSASGRASVVGPADYAGHGGIRIRGSSSANDPRFLKKNFKFETWNAAREEVDVPLLGFSKHSDWVLYASYIDRTLIRDALSYELSNQLGQWAPGTRPVELYLNTGGGKISEADYVGIYILVEPVTRGDGRLDIERLGPEHDAEPEITGGYIIKKDRLGPGDVGFSTPLSGQLVYDYPRGENITALQKTWIRDYLLEFETVLYGASFADPNIGYAKYIDVDSWIDYHLLAELTYNLDTFRTSTFMHMDRGGKLEFGPHWDMDRSMGNQIPHPTLGGPAPTGWYHIANHLVLGQSETGPTYSWWPRLFEDPNFRQKFVDRWFELRETTFSVDNMVSVIDTKALELNEAQARNFQRWDILNLNHFTTPQLVVSPNRFETYEEHVEHLKGWLSERVAWIDQQFVAPPTLSHAGGPIGDGIELTMSAPGSTIYYTTSGVDPRDALANQSTTVLLDAHAPVRAIVPIDDSLGTTWTMGVFDDSTWQSGSTGVGYDRSGFQPLIGLNVLGQIDADGDGINANNSLYARIPFTVGTDLASFTELTLRMKYDDGFVAYLNGVEILRVNSPAETAWNSQAATNRRDSSAPVYEMFDITAHLSLLRAGENVLAIHGLNYDSASNVMLVLPQIVAAAGAIEYTGAPMQVSDTTKIIARSLNSQSRGSSIIHSQWSSPVTATFVGESTGIVVSELMYHPADLTAAEIAAGIVHESAFEYVELVNVGSTTTNLARFQFNQGIAFSFGDMLLAPGERVVVASDLAAFGVRYPNVPNVVGEFTGQLDNGGERISLTDSLGITIQEFTYDDDGPGWHPSTDGIGYSLVVIDATRPVENWDDPAAWRASFTLGGSPGVPETLPGDFNGDDRVDLVDLAFLQSQIGAILDVSPTMGDLNRDGVVDRADVARFVGNFGRSVAASSAAASSVLVLAPVNSRGNESSMGILARRRVRATNVRPMQVISVDFVLDNGIDGDVDLRAVRRQRRPAPPLAALK